MMEYRSLNHQQVLSYLPDRCPWSHKGNYGRVLLLCGSVGYTGAAAMAAMGALRAGAGLVYLGVPESIYAIEAVKLTEPIVLPLAEDHGKLSVESTCKIAELLPRMDAVLVGCGMGQSEGSFAVVKLVLEQAKCPVILDADGINVLSEHMDILRGRTYPTVLTPHDGEFARIGGTIREDRLESAVNFAKQWGCILLLKGYRTCITDGQSHFVNTTGNPGMATGGSGDILAGIIAALIGQGLPSLEAAACGAWLHGAAGDICAKEIGQYGMLPTDMLHALPRLMK